MALQKRDRQSVTEASVPRVRESALSLVASCLRGGRLDVMKVKVAFFALTLCVATDAFANTYRYIDDRGRTVHGSTVPPQFVKNGYEVLNDRGQVIQVVPRAKTAEELAAEEATRAQREAEEAAARVQQEKDNLLLRLYRSPDEIARKRDERVALIDGQLTALAAALTKVEAETERLQKYVDDLKAAGNEAPEQTLETLRIQQQERDRFVAQRERLQSDKATATAEAEADMTRLAELLGVPEDSAAD